MFLQSSQAAAPDTTMANVSLITALSVLPPPPRYPSQAAYNAALGAGHIPPMIETNNILSNPEDQFLVGEGEPFFSCCLSASRLFRR